MKCVLVLDLMMTATKLQCADKSLNLNTPIIMGILNITPDSFSDGGLFKHFDLALQHAEKMVKEGAKIIDIGGESTRPGAAFVSEAEELDRVIPIIEKLHQELDIVISIDTSKAVVITEAAKAGVGFINDVMALQNEDALMAAQQTGLPICLMHMQGQPRSMQLQPNYDNVVDEVIDFLQKRIQCCITQGISRNQLIIDPGFGFGKTLAHNISLFQHLNELKQLGYPVLVGASRKSMIGQITGKNIEQRLAGSLAFAVMAVLNGASIIRVHDVAETVDAVTLTNTLVHN
jgi:dihydropteroate synthase